MQFDFKIPPLQVLQQDITLPEMKPFVFDRDPNVELLSKHFLSFAPTILSRVSPQESCFPFLPPLKTLPTQELTPPPPTVSSPISMISELEKQSHFSTEPVSKHFTCHWENCKESFSTRSGLATHCSTAHLLCHLGHLSEGKKQRVSVHCKWNGCCEEFSTLKQLTKHLSLSSHIGQTPYLSKQQEMEAIEEEDAVQQRRKYPCTIPGCGKRFTDSSNRKKHERTHDVNRPRYKCTEIGCPKSYTTRADLNVHLRVHKKDRANVCTYPNCNKAFVRTSELYAHERTHDNMMPHTCEKCGKSFREKSRLTKHQKMTHVEFLATSNIPATPITCV